MKDSGLTHFKRFTYNKWLLGGGEMRAAVDPNTTPTPDGPMVPPPQFSYTGGGVLMGGAFPSKITMISKRQKKISAYSRVPYRGDRYGGDLK